MQESIGSRACGAAHRRRSAHARALGGVSGDPRAAARARRVASASSRARSTSLPAASLTCSTASLASPLACSSLPSASRSSSPVSLALELLGLALDLVCQTHDRCLLVDSSACRVTRRVRRNVSLDWPRPRGRRLSTLRGRPSRGRADPLLAPRPPSRRIGCGVAACRALPRGRASRARARRAPLKAPSIMPFQVLRMFTPFAAIVGSPPSGSAEPKLAGRRRGRTPPLPRRHRRRVHGGAAPRAARSIDRARARRRRRSRAPTARHADSQTRSHESPRRTDGDLTPRPGGFVRAHADRPEPCSRRANVAWRKSRIDDVVDRASASPRGVRTPRRARCPSSPSQPPARDRVLPPLSSLLEEPGAAGVTATLVGRRACEHARAT